MATVSYFLKTLLYVLSFTWINWVTECVLSADCRIEVNYSLGDAVIDDLGKNKKKAPALFHLLEAAIVFTQMP